MKIFFWKYFNLIITLCCIVYINADVISLNNDNFDTEIAKSDNAFINFYADWCRFSQILKPIFEEVSNNFKNLTDKIIFGAVDCNIHLELCKRFHVMKFPTLKLFSYGEMIKKEYRSQRSTAALTEYVKNQLDIVINELTQTDNLEEKLDSSKGNVIGYFINTNGTQYNNFKKIATLLRSTCNFLFGSGEWVKNVTKNFENAVYFRDKKNNEENLKFPGALDNYDTVKKWLSEKCTPIVRTITFENAEELTEEGLPFLILFRQVGDTQSEKLFSEAVFAELSDKRASINCLFADGKQFAHPLHHLGKSQKDLPLVVIDSFRHMYLFPNFSDLSKKGALRQFVLDLESGKLHREFHNGPDPTKKPNEKTETQPPKSVFTKLKPSGNRYTILNDEL